jgi:hypothetical protein
MERGLWALSGLVLALGGWYLLLLGIAVWVDYLLIGVGVGIGCAVVGSLAHDALAGTNEKP